MAVEQIETPDLREKLGTLLKQRDALLDANNPDQQKIKDCRAQISKICKELDSRHARYRVKLAQFQWQMPHLYEHCLESLHSENEELLDKYLEELAAFRAKFQIKSCPSC